MGRSFVEWVGNAIKQTLVVGVCGMIIATMAGQSPLSPIFKFDYRLRSDDNDDDDDDDDDGFRYRLQNSFNA
jgi:hypothetical protein